MREKFYILLKEHFINLESKLNQLDAVIGDGDHGSTLLKGLSAIPNSELPPEKAFKAETGGASGSLFSILIGAIDKGIENSSSFGEFLISLGLCFFTILTSGFWVSFECVLEGFLV